MAAAAAVLMILTLGGCDAINQKEEGPPKVGLLLMSSPDEQYSDGYYGYLGLKDLEAKYGVEIAYNENVRSLDTAGYLLNGYGRKGYDLVIGVGPMFAKAMLDAAASYPDTAFVCINGKESGGDVTSYDLPDGDAAFLAGAMTAALTTGTKVGYLLPEAETSNLGEFTKGVLAIKNTLTVEEVRVGSATGYADVVGYLNSEGIKTAGLFLNSGEFEAMLADNGITCAVVNGLIGSTAKRQNWPRVGFDYKLAMDRAYSDFMLGRLSGQTVELGFKDRAAFVEGMPGISEEAKGRITALSASLK